jgi:hypothetical protein
VASSRTGAIIPASKDCFHSSTQIHQPFPGFNPGKPNSGRGVIKSFPIDAWCRRNSSFTKTHTVCFPKSSGPCYTSRRGRNRSEDSYNRFAESHPKHSSSSHPAYRSRFAADLNFDIVKAVLHQEQIRSTCAIRSITRHRSFATGSLGDQRSLRRNRVPCFSSPKRNWVHSVIAKGPTSQVRTICENNGAFE